jgi:hypothetical protein
LRPHPGKEAHDCIPGKACDSHGTASVLIGEAASVRLSRGDDHTGIDWGCQGLDYVPEGEERSGAFGFFLFFLVPPGWQEKKASINDLL